MQVGVVLKDIVGDNLDNPPEEGVSRCGNDVPLLNFAPRIRDAGMMDLSVGPVPGGGQVPVCGDETVLGS